MKLFATIICTLLASLCASAQSRIVTMTMHSRLLNAEKEFSVYLPDGYDRTGRDYPVLYLLHGASGNHRSWPESGSAKRIIDAAIAEGRSVEMIVVMPDASGEGEDFNGPHFGYFDQQGWPYERFFVEEFIPFAESRLRISGGKCRRAIAGLSMGGYGTVFYAMRHPELFSSACPLSGRLSGQPDNSRGIYTEEYMHLIDSLGVDKLSAAIDAEQAEALRTVRWRIDCGDDDYLLDGNIDFFQAMRRAGIPAEFRIRNGGHSWLYWQSALPDVLTFVSIGFAEKQIQRDTIVP